MILSIARPVTTTMPLSTSKNVSHCLFIMHVSHRLFQFVSAVHVAPTIALFTNVAVTVKTLFQCAMNDAK